MPTIQLITKINAPIQRCFDLSRSIDLHKETTNQTGEEAIAGVTKGLIALDESVTWRAKHFGIWQQLTSKITAMESPYYFRDEQIKGSFKKLVHDHFFSEEDGYIMMKDHFDFESPLGMAGQFFNKIILTNYMKRFLEERNLVLKQYAESGKGDSFLIDTTAKTVV